MKYVYLTVDVEEWYELDYLKEYSLEDYNVEVVPKIIDFLDLLDKLNVKATFFIVAKIARKNADIIREIVDRGHAIGCHGLDHKLLYDKDNEQYYREIQEGKKLLEEITGIEVEGYRASCFSMEREKLDITQKAGYKYDSSKILFKQHPLYRSLDLSGYNKIDDLVYRNGKFVEYEIPTIQIGKYSIPISGGGYLRLFPYWLIKILIKRYEKQHDNFLIYVHPFELTDVKLPLPEALKKTTKFRALVGRKKNLRKIEKIIMLLKKKNVEFRTLSNDREVRMEN